MANKFYRLTDQATVEMRRIAPEGKIILSDRAARYELRRGTIEQEGTPASAEKPAGA